MPHDAAHHTLKTNTNRAANGVRSFQRRGLLNKLVVLETFQGEQDAPTNFTEESILGFISHAGVNLCSEIGVSLERVCRGGRRAGVNGARIDEGGIGLESFGNAVAHLRLRLS